MNSHFCKNLLILTGLCSVLLLGCSEEKQGKAQQQTPQEPPPVPVEYIVVEQDNVPIWVEFTGKTEASSRIEIRARVAGKLEEAFFKEGEYVKKGEKLFSIEPTSYEAALEKAKAALESNKASLALAKADVKRYEPLVRDGLAPRATLEQYMAREAELAAAIKSDLAQISDAELNLSYTEVLAPISGKIGRKLIDVGNIVGYGGQTVLTTIVANDPMYAYFSPAEHAYQLMSKFKKQDVMIAHARVPDSDDGLLKRTVYKGKVGFNDNVVDKNTGTITMRAEVENPDQDLLEGTFVYVEVYITDEAPLLMVSPAAVQEDQLGSFIYVVDGEKAKRVNIERGYETRHYLVVPKGIKAGDKVIISGLAKIREGRKVSPTDVTAEKGVMAIMKKQDMIPNQ